MKKILLILVALSFVLLWGETVIDESFDSATLPTGWTQVYEEGNISWMPYSGGHNSNPADPHSGARNAYIFAETCTTKLVTPMLNIGGSSTATLTFWHAHVSWLGQQDILKVYYKTAPDANWILIETFDDDLSVWTYESINLPGESSSYYVAFEAVCDWGHGVVLDDVEIEGDPSPVGVVEGHVYNENGIPVTGAEVLIEDVNMSGITQPGGFYQILGVPEGLHSFTASSEGNGFDMTSATVVAGETLTLDFNLQEYVEVMVTGSVITEIGGDPVQGATVTLEGFQDYEVQTAANGQFIITGVYSNNTYQLEVTKEDYNPYSGSITIGEENYNCGDLSIFAPVIITGWVNTTAHPDSGLADAEIALTGFDNHNTTTDSLGYFTLESIYANETYQIDISYDNHNPFEDFVDVEGVDIDLGTVTLVSPVALSGHIVSNLDPEAGLDDADISLSGYAYHSTNSDSLGDFFITDIYANETYEITIEYPNHNTYTAELELADQNLELGTIELIGPVTVSGYIFGSDNLDTGIANAEMSLSGYDDYSTISDSIGYYEFTEVFANQTYTLEINAENYSTHQQQVAVESSNLVLEDIIVDELTQPAGNIQAQIIDEYSTSISWNTPGGGSIYEFRYDDGEPVGEIGLNQPRAVIGAVHDYYAVIDEVQWYLTNAHTHPQVKIYIFGLSNGMPNANDILYQSGLITSYSNQWRTHILPSSVAAPEGFFVGVSTPNRWTDLAIDDGDGEPWIFEAGTQYSTLDYEENTWNDISGYPGAGNLLLRAYGLNLGPSINRDLEGYSIYRMPEEYLMDEEHWELVADTVQDTTYTDSTWWYLNEGTWYYAVQCEHTNGVQSVVAFSNELTKDEPITFDVDVYITNSAGEPIRYAVTSLNSFWNTYNSNSDVNGLADYTGVNAGIYTLNIVHNQYEDQVIEDILITEDTQLEVTLISTDQNPDELITSSGLTGIFPNPFNPETQICFQLESQQNVNIQVYNLKGQKIRNILNEQLPAGEHAINWNADQLPSGIYMIKFQTSNLTQMQKAVLLK